MHNLHDLTNSRPDGTSSDEEEVLSTPAAGTDAEEGTSSAEKTGEEETGAAEDAGAEETGAAESAGAEGTGAEKETSPAKETDAQEGAAPAKESSSAEEASPVRETGTLAVWLNEPGAGGISCGGWAGLGLVAGLLLAAAAAAAAAWLRRRQKEPPAPEEDVHKSGAEAVTVEKLHDQGARPGQQDSFFVSPASENLGLLAIVADGMGGLSDGDKVSQAAVSAMAEGFYHAQGTPEQVLLRLAEQANAAVNRVLGEDGSCRSGSTLTAGLIRDGAFHYLSVGDSRICLYRQGVLYQLNREHVYRNELYVRYVNGEETLEGAANHPKAAGLTSFLGMGQLKYIDLPAQPIAILPGDRFLLMSDGVYNALTAEELTAALEQGPGRSAQALDEAIRAKGYQNQDNYTAVILNC